MVRVDTFPLGVDARRLAQMVARQGTAARAPIPGQRLILSVDRMDISKRIPERLPAFERFRSQCRQWRGQVRLVLICVPSVRDLYEACDPILLPSTADGFGLSLIEAGLLGRAVFCADIPAFRGIGTRLVHRFQLDDEPAGVAARILSWAERDRSHQLRRRVWHEYTWRAGRCNHIEPLLKRMVAPPA